MTDVNTAFAAERADLQNRVNQWNTGGGREQALADSQAAFDKMVAEGKFVDLGGGRYQQTYGMDKGETWTIGRPNQLGQLMAMPEHGLDEMDGGRVRLYSAVPAWHGLGQVIPGGITEIDTVVRLAGLDFDIVRLPAPSYTWNGTEHAVPGLFHQVRSDTGAYLGTTGKVHRNMAVADSMRFMENVVGQQGIIWESAGALQGGAKVFVSTRVPAGITVDPEGIGDRQELFLVVLDDRAGNASFQAMLTPWRPLCKNTNRFALRDATSVIKLRHTASLPERVAQAQRVLGLTVAYADAFAAEETLLARTATKMAEFELVMAELFADGNETTSGQVFGGRDRAEESKRTELANNRREDDLRERFAVESGRVGPTLYAAEQAYTGHLAWGKVRKGSDAAAAWTARIEAELAGTDDQLKTRAHSRLLALAGGGTERR